MSKYENDFTSNGYICTARDLILKYEASATVQCDFGYGISTWKNDYLY